MAYLMGIDLGTSGLKALVMDETGKIIGMSARNYQFQSPHNGYAEQNPEEWWKACCEAVHEILHEGEICPQEIKGIGFSGQMHGAVLLDKNYEIVRLAILHCDARTSMQIREIRNILGDKIIQEEILNPIYSGFLLPSLLWVRENEPDNYEKIAHVCLPKDYLKYKLTGTLSSDYSDASATLAFDIKEVKWSERVLRMMKVPLDFFPPCFQTDEDVGKVSQKASTETGLSEGTIVVAGGGDQVMQGIGNGITQVGGVSVNIGTSGQVSFQSDTPILNPKLSSNTFCGYKKGRWFTMGAIINAGLCLKWCNRLLGQSDYQSINEAVSKVPPGSGGVIFLPYLNGERTPHMNPNLSGELIGLNLNTGPAQLTRAVMEGVTYALMQCMETCKELGLSPGEVMIASGGGAKSREWLQIQADVFDSSLRVAKIQEQACLGAAIAAGVGAKVYDSIEEGCRLVIRYKDFVVEPDKARHEIYMQYYRTYKEVYKSGSAVLETVTGLGRKGGSLPERQGGKCIG